MVPRVLPRRLIVLLLAVAAVAAGGLLLLGDDDDAGRAAIARSKVRAVVVLVLDEFPVDIIRKPDGAIDDVRFPNLAKLASMSTWFPNSATVFDETKWAVPAIADARWPRRHTKPLLPYHPDNAFTLFGRRGWGIVYDDPHSALCPTAYCHRPIKTGKKLYSLLHGRRERLRRFIHAIKQRKRPYFYFTYQNLPHKPWVYLPDGKNDQLTDREPVPDINSTKSFYNQYLTDHNERRQLLQTGFVDREIGVLLRRMRRFGLLDRSIIVVTADHGYAWRLRVPDRRKVTSANIDEVASTPLFIKLPGQRRGRVDPAFVRTMDILPTIARALGIRLDWRHDGRSVFSASARRRRSVRMYTRDFSKLIRISAAAYEARRRADIKRHDAKFLTGADSVRRYGDPWSSVYRFGPFPELLDKPVSSVTVGAPGPVHASIGYASLTRVTHRGSSLVHTHIAGRVDGGQPGAERVIACSVDGTIRALGRSFHLLGESRESFAVLVPERWMGPGRHRIELYEVTQPGGSFVLTPLGSNG